MEQDIIKLSPSKLHYVLKCQCAVGVTSGCLHIDPHCNGTSKYHKAGLALVQLKGTLVKDIYLASTDDEGAQRYRDY